MYFDLYESADGAYQHTDFSEHRQYLLDRMCAQQKAAYHPEDAYWVAFDDSVPQSYPLYIRSRWLDLDGLAQEVAAITLDEHLPFSTGWEWGYWLHDVTSMRNSYELPGRAARRDRATAAAPDLGVDAAAMRRSASANDQHDGADRQLALAAYIAGRDAAIDAGRAIGVISQPDRITFDELVASGRRRRLRDDGDRRRSRCTPTRSISASIARLRRGSRCPTARWTRRATRRPRDRSATRAVHRGVRIRRSSRSHRAGDPSRRLRAGQATELAAQAQAVVARPRRRPARHARATARRQDDEPDHVPVRLPLHGRYAVLLESRARSRSARSSATQTMAPPNCLF